uniref:cation channel sperm-associated protein 1 n=1 Tax=Urocitellus parryii TaxID=9999 RepID=UPI000E55BBAF|nr:cation channel sperm-associated protein 1 [Urocitellus parryii]
MDQSSVTERIQNDLDTVSRPHSSSPYHRPGPSGAHHHETHHHRGPHHHSGLRHHGGPHYQDSENPYSYPFHHRDEAHYRGRAHHYSSPGKGLPHGTVHPQHSSGEDHLNDEHHYGSRMPRGGGSHISGTHHRGGTHSHGESHQHTDSFHRGGPHHRSKHHHSGGHHGETHHLGENLSQYSSAAFYHQGEPPHHPQGEPPHHPQGKPPHHPHGGPYQHGEDYHHDEARLHEPHHYSRPYHPDSHHHRRHPPHGESSSYRSSEGSGFRGVHHHGSHHHREHPGEHHPGENKLSGPATTESRKSRSLLGSSPSYTASHSPGITHTRSWGHSVTQSHVTFYSSPSRRSSKVHPRSSKDTQSWSEDEHFQKRKLGRSPRAHKKMHTTDLFQWLWDKLSYLIWGFRTLIWRLTQSLAFETFIFLVVCLNTVMLVAQTFAEVEIRGEWYFLVLDCIFLCIYVMEALLKIIALGLAYFFDFWNNLDFFIMLMAVLDFVLMQVNSLSFSFYNHSLFRILKVFKSMRALRAIRVLRRLSVLNSLQEVTGTLGHSLPSIAAILTLMFTCLFLFSVVLRALFHKSDPMRFQNIFTTIFTLFTLLTLDDWSLIYMDSRARGTWYIIPILMIYIIIQYFIFLNLVIAVLVDNFQMALLRGLEKVKQEKAAQIHENLLEDSLTELRQTEPEETVSKTTLWNQFIDRKFGAMTDKQRELQFQFLQLVAGVEYQQQKFRSQASVIDEIVDTAFEAGEEDFKK